MSRIEDLDTVAVKMKDLGKKLHLENSVIFVMVADLEQKQIVVRAVGLNNYKDLVPALMMAQKLCETVDDDPNPTLEMAEGN